MEDGYSSSDTELDLYFGDDFDFVKTKICRCCLSRNRLMNNIACFISCFKELAGIKVSDTDGLPPWICFECCDCIQRAVNFKRRLIRSNALLYEYLVIRAPYLIRNRYPNPHLWRCEIPNLYPTLTLSFDNSGKEKSGFHELLMHEKSVPKSKVQTNTIISNTKESNSTTVALITKLVEVKTEPGSSVYENITLKKKAIQNKLHDIDIQVLNADDCTNTDATLTNKSVEVKKEPAVLEYENTFIQEVSVSNSKDINIHTLNIEQCTNTDTILMDKPVEVKEESKFSDNEENVQESIPSNKLLEVDIQLLNTGEMVNSIVTEEQLKEEPEFSDYEDNMTLQEYKMSNGKISEQDLNKILVDTEKLDVSAGFKRKGEMKKDVRKSKKAKKSDKTSEKNESKKKPTVRRTIELDPTKIRIVSLNPEEQLKQREEDNKAGVKFPYQCFLCFVGFNFEVKLQNHMKKHSPSRGPYKCDLCSIYLPNPYSFNVHSLTHTRRYECVACGRRAMDRVAVMDHYRSEHEGIHAMYICDLCGKVSKNDKTHRSHVKLHHIGERPKCSQCGKTFVHKGALSDHMLSHEGVKNYECTTCGKWFMTRTKFKDHQLKHLALKKYYCKECDARFTTSYNLKQHLLKSLRHRDEQTLKYPCARCPKRYESEARLRQHAAVQHEGVRSHACPQCARTLATRSSLAAHINAVHAGKYPARRYTCDTCEKAFRNKNVLVNHFRTHTGEKPFPCSECGRRFAQRSTMRTHHKMVHLKVDRAAKISPLVFTVWNQPPPSPSRDVYVDVPAES